MHRPQLQGKRKFVTIAGFTVHLKQQNQQDIHP